MNPDTDTHAAASEPQTNVPAPSSAMYHIHDAHHHHLMHSHNPREPRLPDLPWYYSILDSSSSVQPMNANGFGGNSPRTIEPSAGPMSLFYRRRRLSHFIAEPNVGRGYIKEIAFGVGGRIIASPFGYGVRLLSFDPDCGELCDRTAAFALSPVHLHEVATNICHGSVVVTTKFSPDSSLLVTGSLGGKVGFHRPRW